MKDNINFKGIITRLWFYFMLLILTVIFGCQDKSNGHQIVIDTPKKNAIIKEKWHWDNSTKQNESAGYAQVIKVGNTLYISGVPTSDLSLEGVTNLYKALKQCLNAFGATSKDVVKETLYTTDIEEMKKHNTARKHFYQGDYPAASWVQVSRLYEPNAKLEVDLIAEITDTNY